MSYFCVCVCVCVYIVQEDKNAATLLLQRDSAVYMDYSPRSVQSDGNCFFRCVALCLFGNQELYKYVRFIAAVEMIRHPAAYDVTSPTFALNGTTVITPPLRSLIRDTLTDGCYAELVHVFAVSSAVSMSVQS